MDFEQSTVFETLTNLDWLAGYRDCLCGVDEVVTEKKKAILKATVGESVEVFPEVISRRIYDRMLNAVVQRTRAGSRFCADLYRGYDPEVFRAIPGLREVIDTNDHFFPELVGTPMARAIPWDFVMALDWTFEVQGGRATPRLIESDTGGVGGPIRLALLFEGMKALLPKRALKKRMEDGSAYLHALFGRFKAVAGVDSRSLCLLITEDDLSPLFGNAEKSFLERLLDRHKIRTLSSWNRASLLYSETEPGFLFEGLPVKGAWVRYYSTALDPEVPGYSRVREVYEHDLFKRHAMPGFWRNYLDQTYRNCYVHNPIGAELFTDKATGSYMNKFIEYYLSETPLLDDQAYVTFFGSSARAPIEDVFDDQEKWVVKSRASTGAGSGVTIGRSCSRAAWDELRTRVQTSPELYIAQRLYETATFSELGGLSKRYPEFRVLAYGIGGRIYPISGVMARTSGSPHEHRSISTGGSNSFVPILIPRATPFSSRRLDEPPEIAPCVGAGFICAKLCEGYYPNWDKVTQQFFWDRDEHVRYVIRPCEEVTKRAVKMLSRSVTRFDMRLNTSFELVLTCLMDPVIMPESWITEEVAEIYRTLHKAGLIRTVEAFHAERLVGGLLGIELGHAFLAETMFRTTEDASKACLATLLIREHERGCRIVDVQVEHQDPHPVRRLGEELMDLGVYLSELRKAVKSMKVVS
ncbi:MAG TPA: circularly permuted type 2 ATP-grasp protein [Verrucomicrobiota bacterium]|nr:circularly permuted type 2 ATP-grasp protein [Verrucomicrobiota bacterium]